MLDIKFILSNKELILQSIKNRQKETIDLKEVEKLYNERNELVQKVDEINKNRKESAENRESERGKELKEEAKVLELNLRETTKKLTNLISKIPNIPLADVPVGKDESENVEIRKHKELKTYSFNPKAHWDLGVDLGIIDNERASKTSGSRFTFLKGDLVKLQFALVQFVLDVVTDEEKLKEIAKDYNIKISTKPFIPVIPPVFIKPDVFWGMARLEPKEDKFFIENENLFLIGSAEHTLGAMHQGEIFDESEFPIRYIGYSTAFRREAGSYGKDTKGILRQHQFDKLEFESFTLPENGKIEQDFLVAIQEYLVKQLEIPYRVMAVCTGDMGGPDLRQIDIEMYMSGQEVYKETHSADYMGEYQSRRLGIKVKKDGKKEFVHMNDATAFAMGRTLIAIIENYQNEDGSITVPKILQKYSGIKEIRKNA